MNEGRPPGSCRSQNFRHVSRGLNVKHKSYTDKFMEANTPPPRPGAVMGEFRPGDRVLTHRYFGEIEATHKATVIEARDTNGDYVVMYDEVGLNSGAFMTVGRSPAYLYRLVDHMQNTKAVAEIDRRAARTPAQRARERFL
jgi:hypothetical protein